MLCCPRLPMLLWRRERARQDVCIRVAGMCERCQMTVCHRACVMRFSQCNS